MRSGRVPALATRTHPRMDPAAFFCAWRLMKMPMLADAGRRRHMSSEDRRRQLIRTNWGRPVCRSDRRRSGRKAEAVENFADGVRRMNGAKNPHAPAAAGALPDVDFEHPVHELRPGIVPEAGSRILNLLQLREP